MNDFNGTFWHNGQGFPSACSRSAVGREILLPQQEVSTGSVNSSNVTGQKYSWEGFSTVVVANEIRSGSHCSRAAKRAYLVPHFLHDVIHELLLFPVRRSISGTSYGQRERERERT